MAGRGSGRWLIVTSASLIIAFFVLVDPIAQDPAYHRFADGRRVLGIPNFWNVATNLAFLIVGTYGQWFVLRNPGVVGDDALRWPWLVFFAGITLTACGSAYYHVAPADGPLLWDRLPMTIAFAGFFTMLIGEYVSLLAARLLLLPFLITGAACIVYSALTEAIGAGDLRPYAVVTLLPVALTPAIIIVHRGASELTGVLWLMFVGYVAAKLFEQFDREVFELLGFVSGHSLKHVFAALSSAVLIVGLHRRRAPTPQAQHA